MAWIQLDNGTARYGMESQGSTNAEPSISNSVIMVVPADSFLQLWVYQNTGFDLSVNAVHGTPSITITVI